MSEKLGLSIRFIRQFDVTTDLYCDHIKPSLADLALMLASQDTREGLTMGEKIADALAFLQSHGTP